MYTYAFEKLDVWQVGRKLVKCIYEITRDFPADEKYGLVSQMRRAGVSVLSNIAEGSTRISLKDQAHFYQLAFGSLVEIISQLTIANDLGYLEKTRHDELRVLAEEIGNKINA